MPRRINSDEIELACRELMAMLPQVVKALRDGLHETLATKLQRVADRFRNALRQRDADLVRKEQAAARKASQKKRP